MFVWRITKDKYASTAFDGIGAQKVGGRFNYPGSSRIVYCACDCLSLSVVEYWVHLPAPKMPPNCSFIRALVPDEVSRRVLTEDDLPVNWNVFPHPDSTREYGTQWLIERETCLLIVPSAVVTQDYNCLINPEHPDFERIEIDSAKPMDFDERLRS